MQYRYKAMLGVLLSLAIPAPASAEPTVTVTAQYEHLAGAENPDTCDVSGDGCQVDLHMDASDPSGIREVEWQVTSGQCTDLRQADVQCTVTESGMWNAQAFATGQDGSVGGNTVSIEMMRAEDLPDPYFALTAPKRFRVSARPFIVVQTRKAIVRLEWQQRRRSGKGVRVACPARVAQNMTGARCFRLPTRKTKRPLPGFIRFQAVASATPDGRLDTEMASATVLREFCPSRRFTKQKARAAGCIQRKPRRRPAGSSARRCVTKPPGVVRQGQCRARASRVSALRTEPTQVRPGRGAASVRPDRLYIREEARYAAIANDR